MPTQKRSPTRPVVIERVRISDYLCFDTLDETFDAPERGKGQWTVVLGDNGVGKSTYLRALALALMDQRTGWSAMDSLGSGSSSVLPGTLIQVDRDDGQQDTWPSKTEPQVLSSGPSERPFPVFGYGAGRGSTFGGTTRSVDLNDPTGPVGTLFRSPKGLIHTETWLQQLAFAALRSKGGQPENYFFAVCAALVSMLPGVDSLDVTDSGAFVIGPAVGRVPISNLSDGFLTTTSWVADLIARWGHAARKQDTALDGDFTDQMTGLVLVDEVDLHLHPLWQRQVIDDLRAAFPAMSFVVTTHSPLTLLGARSKEVLLLQRTDAGVFTRRPDAPTGLRADQVLTDIWFGLSSTLDSGTLDLMREHAEMLRGNTPPSNPKRKQVEQSLRERMDTGAETPEARLAQKLVAGDTSSEPLDASEQTLLRTRLATLPRG